MRSNILQYVSTKYFSTWMKYPSSWIKRMKPTPWQRLSFTGRYTKIWLFWMSLIYRYISRPGMLLIGVIPIKECDLQRPELKYIIDILHLKSPFLLVNFSSVSQFVKYVDVSRIPWLCGVCCVQCAPSWFLPQTTLMRHFHGWRTPIISPSSCFQFALLPQSCTVSSGVETRLLWPCGNPAVGCGHSSDQDIGIPFLTKSN